jgi:hypothetical protein
MISEILFLGRENRTPMPLLPIEWRNMGKSWRIKQEA